MITHKNLKHEYKYWDVIADMVDQHIDIMLNLSQSGHPGGSRSKVHVLIATLLSGVMSWDILNPGKRFGDRFILSAGHTNPAVYGILAVFNEALRRKYIETGDVKYLNPMGDEFNLYPEDTLTLRRIGGLPGHAEMEGKTLFFKANTGPSGHGFPFAAGQAFALKYAGLDNVKVFAIEGEGGLTAGITHETKNTAFGLGLGNLITIVDWNDYGIDNRPFSKVVNGTPEDWFKPYGWKVSGAEDGTNWEQIVNAYEELLNHDADSNQPKMLWVKTKKGRGYGIYDNDSHGAPHKRNSTGFWDTKRSFADKYNLTFKNMDKSGFEEDDLNKMQMQDCLDTVLSLFESQDGLLDYLAEKLISIGDSVFESDSSSDQFIENPLNDPEIYDYRNYPANLYKNPGEKAPNRAGMSSFGAWINSFSLKKYGRPLFIAASADLAGSTNINGFANSWGDSKGLGMYDRSDNQKGNLLPQAITEFANAALMAGISSVNFNNNVYKEFNGYLTASSTYSAFSYLKYGAFRVYSQMVQDSQFKLGKTIWIAGHSGPETGEDSRTHFGIFAPGVTQLFPKGQVLNIHPWEYNEVPVMLGEALKMDIPIIVLHLTRPPVEIPDRKKLGIASHFDSAKGAYIIKDFDNDRPKQGVVMVRGTMVISNIISMIPKIIEQGPNIKIVAILSNGLFELQTKEYQNSIISNDEWLDSMIITNSGIDIMHNWIKHPIVKEYSLSTDWDNRWRSGGRISEVLEEAHLSERWQWKAITKFSYERKNRLSVINKSIPKY
jgi:transketolase